eukprot:6485796-Amphidinium_carterae.1
MWSGSTPSSAGNSSPPSFMVSPYEALVPVFFASMCTGIQTGPVCDCGFPGALRSDAELAGSESARSGDVVCSEKFKESCGVAR